MNKQMIKKQYTFVRYGKLKPVKQKGVKSNSFHSPPCSKGFYAFPFGHEEMFLVAGLGYQKDVCLPTITKHEVYRYHDRTRDKVVEHKDTYETPDIWLQKHRFTVSQRDLIWHHLGAHVLNPKDILQKRKEWVQTTVAVWRKTFNRVLSKQQAETWKSLKGGEGDIREVKPGGWYSKDHLEVFFEKI